ncbi:hypothetical protein [Achromobacter insolitus]|uniref:hypothetical protein n=1 Tax=Achromobacter insolitus TaxID=217204 RepID=UPI00174D22B2|nr:hypothetical protein [Achromobacter insolitus]
MNKLPESVEARSLDRLNLRLPQETVEAVDNVRARRIGNVSRNTWITEAIEEKLRREGEIATTHNGERKAHD